MLNITDVPENANKHIHTRPYTLHSVPQLLSLMEKQTKKFQGECIRMETRDIGRNVMCFSPQKLACLHGIALWLPLSDTCGVNQQGMGQWGVPVGELYLSG